MYEETIKVLIAEDSDSIQRKYLRIVERDPSIKIVGSAMSGHEAVMLSNLSHPHVVLMDIEMEEKDSGIKATQQILQIFPNIKIAIMTVHEEDELIISAFQAGAVDYILKNSSPEDILSCIKNAYYERSPMHPMIANKIRKEFRRIKSEEDTFVYNLNIVSQLTHSELIILKLYKQGKTRAEICKIRCVELSTIKTQIRSILLKFNKKKISEVFQLLDKSMLLKFIEKVDINI